MVHDQLIRGHFARAYRDRYVVVANIDGQMLVCDGFAILKVEPDHDVFDSRAQFPRLPAMGEAIRYATDGTSSPYDIGRVRKVWDMALAKSLYVAKATKWLYEVPLSMSGVARAIERTDGSIVLVDRALTNLVSNDPTSITEYWRWRCGGDGDPVIVLDKEDDALIAVIMPIDMRMTGIPQLLPVIDPSVPS